MPILFRKSLKDRVPPQQLSSPLDDCTILILPFPPTFLPSFAKRQLVNRTNAMDTQTITTANWCASERPSRVQIAGKEYEGSMNSRDFYDQKTRIQILTVFLGLKLCLTFVSFLENYKLDNKNHQKCTMLQTTVPNRH